MSNLNVALPAVDGSVYDVHEFGESCKEAIHTLYSDDFAAPPRSMNFTVQTESGKTVLLRIPYDHEDKVRVYVNNEQI
ncbi:MAG: hypothetical protein FWC23_01425 [Chitinispirillia bacterium]|nr:hypothetical protein [Chitinispirillia bacterium]MCL2267837.1 hypothetical protein [Chitinispirillia bacterium]